MCLGGSRHDMLCRCSILGKDRRDYNISNERKPDAKINFPDSLPLPPSDDDAADGAAGASTAGTAAD